MNIHQLKETRAAKITAMQALGDNPDPAKFDALEGEVRAIDRQIKNANTMAELERHAEAEPDVNVEKELRSYSVGKAIRESAAGTLTGIEREMHDEFSKGTETRGVRIPTSMILGEQRAMTTSGSASNTIATTLGGLIDRLRPSMAIQQLGATVISGLSGNLDLPRLTGGPTSHWIAEEGTTTASDSTFDKVSLTPHTVCGQMYLSRRLILQNSVALENVLRSDLSFVLSQALDKAAVRGGGTNEPHGILSVISENGTSETALGDIAADLISSLEIDDVSGTGGFLTNSQVMKVARKIREDDSGRLIPVAETFHNQNVVSSNNVDDDGSSPASNPLIYGVWSNLMLGYWSSIDILNDPYGAANKGGLNIYAFLDADVAVRHPEAFAWKGV